MHSVEIYADSLLFMIKIIRMETKSNSPMCKSPTAVTKATFTVTNKRILRVEKEAKEWKTEMEIWWKEKANLIEMVFNEGKQWKKEKVDLHLQVQALPENFRP